MRLFAKVVGVTAVAALALTGCGRGSDSGGSGGGGGSTGGSSGFPADAVIGVSLPQKTSENWVLAESLFNDGLKQAGFKGDVQFANGGGEFRGDGRPFVAVIRITPFTVCGNAATPSTTTIKNTFGQQYLP